MTGSRPLLRVHLQSTANLASHGRQQLRTHSWLCLIICGNSSTVILDDQNPFCLLDMERDSDDTAVVFPKTMLDRVGHQLVDNQSKWHCLFQAQQRRVGLDREGDLLPPVCPYQLGAQVIDELTDVKAGEVLGSPKFCVDDPGVFGSTTCSLRMCEHSTAQ